MHTGHSEYLSYLLRLWRESADGAWHASLQSTATEQFVHFADVAALLAFLMVQTDAPAGDPAAEQRTPAE